MVDVSTSTNIFLIPVNTSYFTSVNRCYVYTPESWDVSVFLCHIYQGTNFFFKYQSRLNLYLQKITHDD